MLITLDQTTTRQRDDYNQKVDRTNTQAKSGLETMAAEKPIIYNCRGRKSYLGMLEYSILQYNDEHPGIARKKTGVGSKSRPPPAANALMNDSSFASSTGLFVIVPGQPRSDDLG